MQENPLDSMPNVEAKNKTFVIVSAILLLMIALIIAIFFNKNQANPDLNQEEIDQSIDVQEEKLDADLEQTEQESNLVFADLVDKKEGSYHCQIDNEDGFYSYYLHNQLVAIEVKIPNSHTKTIIDQDFTYTWNIDEKVGTKISNQTEQLEVGEQLQVEELTADLPEEDVLPPEDIGPFDPANFVCETWVADESLFIPPAEVMFQDLSEILP